MDPDVALVTLRTWLGSRDWEWFERQNSSDGLRVVRESFEALDDWLSRGGALPADWAKARGEHSKGAERVRAEFLRWRDGGPPISDEEARGEHG